MNSLHNLERSGFHRGEYVAYADGAVYRVKRRESGGWVASRTNNGFSDAGAGFIFGRTLAEISRKLGA